MKLNKKSTKWDTATGVLQTDGTVQIENCILPQFTRKCYITMSFHMYQKRSKDKYVFILGRDLLQDIGLDIDYSNSQFVWDNIIVDMVPCGFWTKKKIESTAQIWRQNGKSSAKAKTKELHLAEIKPAEYKPINIEDIMQSQAPLTPTEQDQLQQMLLDFQDLFKGQKGNYNGELIQLELIPGSKPFYAKPFSIPKAYQQVTKYEITCFESIGLLTKVTAAEWAAPTFIIPKKNQTVRVITDFRGLNKCLKRNPFPMPKIPDIFCGMEKFQYATTIDLNMGYYSMPLSKEAKKLCVISLPWGLYQYNMLPMGIKPATDIFQQRMGALFFDMPVVVIFMDDTIVFGYADFGAHLIDVTEVLRRLQQVGMQVNPDK